MLNPISLATLRIKDAERELFSSRLRLVEVVQLLKLHLIWDTSMCIVRHNCPIIYN